MRNLILLAVLSISMLACKQEMRYTQSSTEIDAYKALLAAYEAGDWETFKAGFADTAKVYHNTNSKPESAAEIASTHIETLAGYSSYGFDNDEGDIEMVVTDKGETWVNFWGVWTGTMTANGKNYEIPVHTTSQWVDGKIVKEYGYWNNAEVMMDVMAMEAEASMEEEMPAEQ